MFAFIAISPHANCLHESLHFYTCSIGESLPQRGSYNGAVSEMEKTIQATELRQLPGYQKRRDRGREEENRGPHCGGKAEGHEGRAHAAREILKVYFKQK